MWYLTNAQSTLQSGPKPDRREDRRYAPTTTNWIPSRTVMSGPHSYASDDIVANQRVSGLSSAGVH